MNNSVNRDLFKAGSFFNIPPDGFTSYDYIHLNTLVNILFFFYLLYGNRQFDLEMLIRNLPPVRNKGLWDSNGKIQNNKLSGHRNSHNFKIPLNICDESLTPFFVTTQFALDIHTVIIQKKHFKTGGCNRYHSH